MRRACEILGVNQSTLRVWTNSGRVPAFLTPGGHRRYRESDLRTFLEPPTRSDEGAPLSAMLLASHEQYRVVARRAFESNSWFRQFDESALRHFRLLGNSLLGLLSSYVVTESRGERERSLRRGREVAAEYGQVAAALGLSLPQATEAFLLFRGPVLDTVHRWVQEQPRPSATAHERLKRLNHVMDRVLLSMAAAHEHCRDDPSSASSS